MLSRWVADAARATIVPSMRIQGIQTLSQMREAIPDLVIYRSRDARDGRFGTCRANSSPLSARASDPPDGTR